MPEVVYGFNITNLSAEFQCNAHRNTNQGRASVNAQGYRQDNPAADAIGAALPKNGVAKQHHRALAQAEVAGAIATVRASRANWATVAAIEFLILTAARSGEARKACWDEVDLGTAT